MRNFRSSKLRLLRRKPSIRQQPPFDSDGGYSVRLWVLAPVSPEVDHFRHRRHDLPTSPNLLARWRRDRRAGKGIQIEGSPPDEPHARLPRASVNSAVLLSS